MSAAPELRAPNLVLRALLLSDAADLHAAHGDPHAHKYWSGPPFENLAQTQAYIAETLAAPHACVWAITDNGRTALGRITLFILREGVGEIGIILRRDAQGRGLAGGALKLVEAHAFSELGLHRLAADIDPDNAASLKLFKRAGFAREGRLRGNWKTHIGVRDSIIMAKLRPLR